MRPYLGAALRRSSVIDADSISASLYTFLATAPTSTTALWSEAFWGTTPSAMFPGIVAIALAGAAFAARRRTAPRGVRRMLTGIGAAGVVLSLGMLTPVYGALAIVMPPLLGLPGAVPASACWRSSRLPHSPGSAGAPCVRA